MTFSQVLFCGKQNKTWAKDLTGTLKLDLDSKVSQCVFSATQENIHRLCILIRRDVQLALKERQGLDERSYQYRSECEMETDEEIKLNAWGGE